VCSHARIPQGGTVLWDDIIQIKVPTTGQPDRLQLRRIVIWREDELQNLTNEAKNPNKIAPVTVPNPLIWTAGIIPEDYCNGALIRHVDKWSQNDGWRARHSAKPWG
jgi:hypothetical protein